MDTPPTPPAPAVVQRPLPGVETGSDFVVLRWTASAAPDFSSYEIHELPDSMSADAAAKILGPATLRAIVGDRATTLYRIAPLSANSDHFFVVRTTVKNGAFSLSNVVRGRTVTGDPPPPEPITLFQPISFTSNSVVLRWSSNCQRDFAFYTVYASTVSGFTPGSANQVAVDNYCTDTTLSVNALRSSTTYYFRVAVTNFALKSTITNEVSQTTRAGGDTIPPVPPAIYQPLTRQFEHITGNTIRIRWTAAPDTDWSAYFVYYSTDPTFVPGAATLADTIQRLDDTTFTFTDLKPATAYYFQVKSEDFAGNFSDPQPNVKGVTSPPLDPLFSFGGYGVGAGQFKEPRSAKFDNQGHLYVADTGNNRVEEFAAPAAENPDLRMTLQIPRPGDNSVSLSLPSDMAVDDSSNIYVCDSGHSRIVRVGPDGSFQFAFGSSGTTNGRFQNPVSVTVDALGFVWVADRDNNRLQKFTRTGGFVGAFSAAQSGNLAHPNAVIYSPFEGDLIVTDQDNQRVTRFALDGTGIGGDVGVFDVAGSDSGQFRQPTSAGMDSSGALFVADAANDRIQVFVHGAANPLAIMRTTIGLNDSEDFNKNMIRLSHPKAVASYGSRIVVLDSGNSRAVVTNVVLSSLLKRPVLHRISVATSRRWSVSSSRRAVRR